MTDPNSSDDQLTDVEHALIAVADSMSTTPRSPVLGNPGDHGLAYDDVTFPSEDGVALEGWWIPRDGADKVVIVAHPRGFSRTGLPADEEPWRAAFAATGNDIRVDLLPDMAILHDAGYHVLAYDLRNLGLSGAANGGVTSSGILESRDVIGSLRYVRSRPETETAQIALFSRCLGADSTLFAIDRRPGEFTGVRALIACQPLSPAMTAASALARQGIDRSHLERLSHLVRLRTSFTLEQMSPVRAAASVRVPTLVYQVHDDVMTEPGDVQAIYDAIPADVAKSLFWIEDTTRRWDGYLHFQRSPDRVLQWLTTHFA